jgi:hypothetical protein
VRDREKRLLRVGDGIDPDPPGRAAPANHDGEALHGSPFLTVAGTTDGFRDVNVLQTLPRISRSFSPVAFDLGQYNLLDCPAAGDPSFCGISSEVTDINGFTSQLASGPSVNSLAQYAESIAIYAAVAILIAVLGPILAFLWCCCRCHLTCCLCGLKGGCFCCGRGIPTEASLHSCCSCGFRELSDPFVHDTVGPSGSGITPKRNRELDFHYRPCERWANRICLYVYGAAVIGFAVTAHFMGSVKLTEGMLLVNHVTSSLDPFVDGMFDTVGTLAVEVTAGTVVPLVQRVNRTVHGVTTLPAFRQQLQCVASKSRSTVTGVRSTITGVNNLVSSLDGIELDINSLSTSLTSINGTITSLLGSDVMLIKNGLLSVKTLKQNAPGVITDTISAIDGIDTALTGFKSSTTGLPAVSTRLGYFVNRPTDTQATNSKTHLQTMAAGGYAGSAQQAARDTAITLLTTVNSSASNLALVVGLADLLTQLNSDIDAFRAADRTGNMLRSINRTQDLIAAIPDIAAMRTAANTTANRIAATKAQIGPVKTLISSLDGKIGSLDLSFIDSVDGVLNTADGLLACARSLFDVADNLTVLFVKESVTASFRPMIDTVSGQLGDARSQLSSSQSLKQSLLNQINTFNASSYTTTLDSVTAVNVTQLTSFDVPTTVTSTASGVDFSSAFAQVKSVNGTVFDPTVKVNATIIAQLRSIESLLGNASTAASQGLSAALVYNVKRCTSTGNACTVDGDCGAGTCQGGLALCIDKTTLQGPGTFTACTSTADCSSSQVCSLQSEIMAGSATAFNLYAAASKPDLAASKAAVDSLQSTVSSVSSLSGPRSSMTTFQSAINSVTIDPDVTIAQIDASLAQATLSRSMIGTVSSLLSTVLSQLSLKSTLTSMKDMLNSVNSQLDLVDSVAGRILDGMPGLLAFEAYFYGPLTRHFEAELSEAGLNGVLTRRGLKGVFQTLATVGDEFYGEVKSLSKAFALDILPSFNATDYLNQYTPLADELLLTANREKGNVFYFTNALTKFGLLSDTMFIDDSTGSVRVDSAGKAYPNGASCVTGKCINNTIIGVNQQTLGNAIKLAGVEPPFDVPLTREIIFSLPLVLPILVMIVGVLPAFCCCCSCSCQNCCVRCLSCWHQCLACTMMPFIFLIAGALLFPLIMVTSDVCASGLNVGFTFVEGSEAAICKLATGTFQGPQDCRVVLPFDNGSAPIKLDIPTTYASLFRADGCTTEGTAAVKELVTSLGSLAGVGVRWAIDNMVFGFASAQGYTVASTLRGIFSSTEADIVRATGKVLDTLSKNALSCNSINRLVGSTMDLMCCGFITPLYWSVSMWYLIAFSMCLCGWGGSMFAYKRLPNKLWGYFFQEAVSADTLSRAMRAGEGLDPMSALEAGDARSAKVTPELDGRTMKAADAESFSFEQRSGRVHGASHVGSVPNPPRVGRAGVQGAGPTTRQAVLRSNAGRR